MVVDGMFAEEASAWATCALRGNLELKDELLLLVRTAKEESLLPVVASAASFVPVLVYLDLGFV